MLEGSIGSRNGRARQLDRRYFIGGSDARIIMGSDEASLLRLWREKRGEAELEDLSGNLIVRLGAATEELNRIWYERNTGQRVTSVQRRVKHSAIPWMMATLDGLVEGNRGCLRSQVHVALVILREGRRGEVYGPGPAQYVVVREEFGSD
jgi:predicted phage-related endonuclease